MGQKYLQLAQRVQIETLLKEGHNLSFIANTLGYSRATITKEIQRTTLHAKMDRKVSTHISRRMYRAIEGQTLADQKQRNKKKSPTKLTLRREQLIKKYTLEHKWSPEQIAKGPLRVLVCPLKPSTIGLIIKELRDSITGPYEIKASGNAIISER
ncbi:helix-turn-helix domain-containing protein [Fructobacillus sp. M131]|nr:helix-turn-helix domain-containing protein [Fructobacillus cardui]MCK8628056.1 helix-turn-helix domain-containing protein [Fructobacillus cardui]